MFAVDCAECEQRYLLSVHSVDALHTLEPGVFLVELICHQGHQVTVVTGRAVTASTEGAAIGPASSAGAVAEDSTSAEGSVVVPDQLPTLWSWAYSGGAGVGSGRIWHRLVRFIERQAQLSRWYVRGLHH